MKLVINSAELFNQLNIVGKVISNKNTLPILDYFLFILMIGWGDGGIYNIIKMNDV